MASLHINQIEKKFAPSKTGQQAPFALGPIDLTIREGAVSYTHLTLPTICSV